VKLHEFAEIIARAAEAIPNAEIVVRRDLGPDQTWAIRGVTFEPDEWDRLPDGRGWLIIETGAASLPDDPYGVTRRQ
jgi:hypothetical protein